MYGLNWFTWAATFLLYFSWWADYYTVYYWEGLPVPCHVYGIHFLAALFVTCFYLSYSTDPGSPPPKWTPPRLTEELKQAGLKEQQGIQRRSDISPVRYCEICEAYKPPRTHHCSQCKKCRLRYDHHCGWIDNCIGVRNHKYFILFLMYGVICCVYVLGCLGTTFVDHIRRPELEVGVLRFIIMPFAMAGSMIASVFMGLLFYQQTQLVIHNITTLETWQKEWAEEDTQRHGLEYHYPYHLGLWRNMKDILGPRIWLWALPWPDFGSGLDYPPLIDESVYLELYRRL